MEPRTPYGAPDALVREAAPHRRILHIVESPLVRYTSRCTRPRSTTAPPRAGLAKEFVMGPSRFLVVILIFLSASIIAPASGGQTVKTIHSFDGADGQNPHLMILSQGHDGALYGTTNDEGAYGTGTVFKLTLQGQITVLHNFQDNDGAYPLGGVTLTPSGSFFGTTQ